MGTMILVGKWIALVMDWPLGWLLWLPRDVAIVIVAVGTSAILTLARRWTTNQDLMRRCRDDMGRLKQLRKQARKNKDKARVKGINTTVAMIQMTRMKAEGWGLLGSLVPIVLLACWAFERLDYLPPKVGDELEVRATFPAAAASHQEPAWLMARPADPVRIESTEAGADGRIIAHSKPTQIIRKDDNVDPVTGQQIETTMVNGLATWRLRVLAPADSVVLRINYQNKYIEHPLRVGKRSYADAILLHNDKGDPPWPDCSSWVVMRQAWFLDYVPGVSRVWKWWVGNMWVNWMAPWLVAYLVIAVPFVPLLRKFTKTY